MPPFATVWVVRVKLLQDWPTKAGENSPSGVVFTAVFPGQKFGPRTKSWTSTVRVMLCTMLPAVAVMVML